MCPLAGPASSGTNFGGHEARVPDAMPRPGHKAAHAMNMRAAEAIVSSAPKPMKIFPISEVLSQVLSLLAALPAITGAAGEAAGGSAAAMAIGPAGALASCSARSTSL